MKNKPNRGQRYFPNNWRAVRDLPDKYLPSLSFEEFLEWKVYGYQIPDSVYAIIRIRDNNTGTYKEQFYNTELGAKNCVARSMHDDKDITMCTMDGMFYISPHKPIDFNNE